MPGMPLLASLYPDPPYEYRGSRLVTAAVTGSLRPGVLPDGLDMAPDPMITVVFADYPDTTIGPYREAIVLVGCSYRGTVGLYCPFIYVDSDAALAAGREVWGFPKKFADIELDATGSTVRGRLSRLGSALLVLDGDAPEPTDPAVAGAAAALPIYNHKVVPGVAAREPDVDCLTEVRLEMTGREAWLGSGTLRTGGEVAQVLGEAGPVQLIRAVVDSVLPAGGRLG